MPTIPANVRKNLQFCTFKNNLIVKHLRFCICKQGYDKAWRVVGRRKGWRMGGVCIFPKIIFFPTSFSTMICFRQSALQIGIKFIFFPLPEVFCHNFFPQLNFPPFSLFLPFFFSPKLKKKNLKLGNIYPWEEGVVVTLKHFIDRFRLRIKTCSCNSAHFALS